MKYIHAYALFLVFVFCIPCYGQNQTNASKDSIKTATNDTVSVYGPNRMVRNVKQSSNGSILIAASFAGVFRYDGKLFTNLTNKLGARRYWNVLEDRRGNLWIATTDSGVYYHDGKSFKHFTTKEGLANNSVGPIYEDKAGNIWFGTGGGVSRYDGTSFQNFTTKDGLPNNGINTILEDKTGKMWFGTSGDACFYDGKAFTVFRNKDGRAFHNVWSIIEDRKGNIWLGGSVIDNIKDGTLYVSPGLWRYDGSTFTKVSQRGVSAIIEDKKGNIWTTGALNANGAGTWTLSLYDHNSLFDKKPVVTEVMSIERMLCGILEDDKGNIWFGSMNGVYRYDGKTITDFRSK